MKREDMKGKTILLVEYEKVYPELDKETEKRYKKEGIVTYRLNKNKITDVVKAEIYFVDEKKDPLDDMKICKLYYKTENGKSGALRVDHKATFTEVFPNLFINSNLLYLTDQIKSLLNF